MEVAGGLAQGLRANYALQQSALQSVGGALGHSGGVDNEMSLTMRGGGGTNEFIFWLSEGKNRIDNVYYIS